MTDVKDTQNEIRPHEHLAPERATPPHGVPEGAAEATPKGLPDSERHESESGPHEA